MLFRIGWIPWTLFLVAAGPLWAQSSDAPPEHRATAWSLMLDDMAIQSPGLMTINRAQLAHYAGSQTGRVLLHLAAYSHVEADGEADNQDSPADVPLENTATKNTATKNTATKNTATKNTATKNTAQVSASPVVAAPVSNDPVLVAPAAPKPQAPPKPAIRSVDAALPPVSETQDFESNEMYHAQMIITRGKADGSKSVVSRPQIMTLEGQQAMIEIGEQNGESFGVEIVIRRVRTKQELMEQNKKNKQQAVPDSGVDPSSDADQPQPEASTDAQIREAQEHWVELGTQQWRQDYLLDSGHEDVAREWAQHGLDAELEPITNPQTTDAQNLDAQGTDAQDTDRQNTAVQGTEGWLSDQRQEEGESQWDRLDSTHPPAAIHPEESLNAIIIPSRESSDWRMSKEKAVWPTPDVWNSTRVPTPSRSKENHSCIPQHAPHQVAVVSHASPLMDASSKLPAAPDDPYFARKLQYESHYQGKQESLLRHVPEVRVAVDVQLNPLVQEMHQATRQEGGESTLVVEQTSPLTPSSVRVAIAFPDRYVKQIWEAQSTDDSGPTAEELMVILDQVKSSIRELVATVLPPNASGENPITIHPFVALTAPQGPVSLASALGGTPASTRSQMTPSSLNQSQLSAAPWLLGLIGITLLCASIGAAVMFRRAPSISQPNDVLAPYSAIPGANRDDDQSLAA